MHRSAVSSASAIANTAIKRGGAVLRKNWTKKEISEIYNQPLLELSFQAASVHRQHHDASKVQLCTLLNIKQGGCSEDCSYCSQSSRHSTGLKAEKMMDVDSVIKAAKIAKENGSTRFCMGAAWREMKGRKSAMNRIKQMVSEIDKLGLETCVTLGMLDSNQAQDLKSAGLTAYNHNIDTSREFYPSVITSRSYDDRLQTIDNVRNAGINVCSGGILGLGESSDDHISFLHTLSTMPKYPESVPINSLVPIKGTPLENNKRIPFTNILRTISTARIIMPPSIIRIAAGRTEMSDEQQALAFMSGANAIFTGDQMLTTACNGWEKDAKLFNDWGLTGLEPFTTTTKKIDENDNHNHHHEQPKQEGDINISQSETVV